METIGSRLRQERMRLGMTLQEMAAAGGVLEHAQIQYEKDRRHLRATYIAGVAKRGVDLSFVMFGTRLVGRDVIPAEEASLIRNLRAIGKREHDAFVHLITSMGRSTMRTD